MSDANQDLKFVIDAENPYNYQPQGFHPIHIGDSFSDGRYTVLHKLGHGKSSTIWVVHDANDNSLKSLKVVAAWRSDTEVQVLRHLEANFDEQEEGSQHVARMFDAFIHEGPNGRHQCIVGEVLGPNLASYVGNFWASERFPPEMVRRMFGQIALGVRYLHKRDVAHGDLHQGNILLRLPITWRTASDVEQDLGVAGEHEYGADLTSPHQPRYLVPGMCDDPYLLQLCLRQPHIKICDFSESSIPTLTDPPYLASPLILRPPEAILGFLEHPTLQSDIWALAVLCHLLFANGRSLFYRGDKMLLDMVLNLGKLPEELWTSWPGHTDFDDQGRAIRGPNVSIFLKFGFETIPEGKERKVLETLLRSMVCYDTQKRLTAEQVVVSEWVAEYCRPQMGPEVTYVVENMDE
ncbi:Protein kinase [Mycena indigotica]|uniref:non-specific serine/threonine protein kinase n=1 Tax=Mycena indigotica TaxID=2126181 RepID=A0A8H6WEZ2_9AGAR|nr:Protein kinase [Mycena indigotica]KAF7316214.1 Protein kinase [Mycena indigotica]